MIKLFKRFYRYDEMISEETKSTVLKHKKRVEYFIIFIPAMFILVGYLSNGIIEDDYTNFKLFLRFTQDFLYKVNFNIFPISLMFAIVSILIITLYKPNIVHLFWSLSVFLILGYLLIPNAESYMIEFVYQVSIVVDKYNSLIAFVFSSISISFLIYKKTRMYFVMIIKNSVELFLFSSIVYLEVIGDYELFFFSKKFAALFSQSIQLFNGTWEIIVTLFVSLVFLSLYNKKIASLIFFIKNKRFMSREKRRLVDCSHHEVIKVSDKIEIPLLKYDCLPKLGVIVPAFNEAAVICDTVHSLLNADYKKENILIFVVSDGSTDETLNVLKQKYDMYEIHINKTFDFIGHKQAKTMYMSSIYKNLILIDKYNGGKSDSLNLGLEYLPFDMEYVSVIDADSIVDKYAFRILATNAKRNGKIAALTGTILPRKQKENSGFKSLLLTNIQMFDYLNSFHGERGALDILNAILIIPGAFGFFKRDVLLDLKGYPKDVLAEDGILTVNIHKTKKFKIRFTPEAICYTQVPSTFKDLRKQRVRWFKGLTEILTFIRKLWVSNLKLTFVSLDYLFIEWITPILAPIGLYIVIANPTMVTYPIFYMFMLLAIITPLIQGVLCLLIESSYRKVRFTRLIYLPLIVIMSPLITLWRNDAMLDLKNKKWGSIKRY